ncbi:MAG: hypothetical protein M1436_02725 [Acidobacteria bacterium]|nr:hypothetical protein [Acidobacteriota bacterium]
MFPFVYGFHWTFGNLVFLGVFFSVLAVIAATVLVALVRAFKAKRELEQIRWHADFNDLPRPDRHCRHDYDGTIPGRVCGNLFECWACEKHAELLASAKNEEPKPAEEVVSGMRVPLDRYYHRGHTWVRPQEDGTVLVGLDELGRRMAGRPEEVELPAPGARVRVNGTAWRFARNGGNARVLSPVNGTVVETGGAQSDWYLRVRPDTPRWDHTHLLRGSEVRPWMSREVDRVGGLVGMAAADGGVLVEDAPAALPRADWDAVWGGVFLEP